MDTRVFTISRTPLVPESLNEAAAILAEGGLAVFPTETVYGMGARHDRPEAVKRLAEQRAGGDASKLTLHIAHPMDVAAWVQDLPSVAERVIRKLWPGPLTVVLPCRDGSTRGFRLPEDEIARELLRRTGSAVLATGVTKGAGVAIVEPAEVLREVQGKAEAFVDGGRPRYGKPSTIVEFSRDGFEVTREGVIPRARVIESGRLRVLFVCTGNTCRSPMAAALLRRALALRVGVAEDKLPERGYVVESAGVGAYPGAPLSPNAREVLRESGCRFTEHSARTLTPDMIEQADRIYTMTRSHLEQVITMVPGAAAKARRLDPGKDVEDPMGGSVEAYRSAARQIKRALESVVKSL